MAEEIVTEVEYRDIPGFEGYRAGSDGTIWSCWEKVSYGRYGSIQRLTSEWVQRKCYLNKRDGYYRVGMKPTGALPKVRKTMKVATCVLLAFVGKRPQGHEACHNDGNRTNDTKDNLRWDTPQNNQADRVSHGTDIKGEKIPWAELTEGQVKAIRERFRQGGITKRQLAEQFNVTPSNIGYVIKKRSWKHVA